MTSGLHGGPRKRLQLREIFSCSDGDSVSLQRDVRVLPCALVDQRGCTDRWLIAAHAHPGLVHDPRGSQPEDRGSDPAQTTELMWTRGPLRPLGNLHLGPSLVRCRTSPRGVLPGIGGYEGVGLVASRKIQPNSGDPPPELAGLSACEATVDLVFLVVFLVILVPIQLDPPVAPDWVLA